MKKFLAVLLSAALALSMTACKEDEEPYSKNRDKESSTVSDDSSSDSSDAASGGESEGNSGDSSHGSSSAAESEPEESSEPEPEEPASNEADFNWDCYYDPTIDYYYDAYIKGYKGADENVVIPSKIRDIPVTKIEEAFGNNGLRGNIDITSVTIPASVTYIGNYAFKDCINLNEVIFLGDTPDFLLTSFEGTPWLNAYLEKGVDENGLLIIEGAVVKASQTNSPENVVIPDGVKQINRFAFSNFDEVTSQSMTDYYGNEVIHNNFTSVTIPDSVTKIYDGAFYKCNRLTSVKMPSHLTELGALAFDHCEKLSSITLPKGIMKIKDSTFNYCKALKTIDVPNGVTAIGGGAFSNCPAAINLPDTVVSVDGYVLGTGSATFKGNTYTNKTNSDFVTAIEQNAIEQEFGDKDFVINGGVLEKVRPDVTKIELPDSVTEISNNAFNNCDKNLIIVFKGKNYNLANLNKLKEAVSGN